MSWFEEWFDSPLYEKLYSNRNEDEATLLVNLIEEKIPKQNYPKILDLGCGRGRHSISLALRGYQVTGVDLSEVAIKLAKQRAKEKDAEVDFFVGDMRDSLNITFDAIVNLFTTFGYFIHDHENENVIANASQMMKPEGLLLIDYFNSRQVEKKLVPGDAGSFKDLEFYITRYIEDGMVFKEILFEGPSLKKPVQYIERVKLYDLSWFKKVFIKNRLQLISVFGDYKGGAFDPENSSRMIMVSNKTK